MMLRFIAYASAMWVLIYLLAAFIAADADFRNWDAFGRCLVVFMFATTLPALWAETRNLPWA